MSEPTDNSEPKFDQQNQKVDRQTNIAGNQNVSQTTNHEIQINGSSYGRLVRVLLVVAILGGLAASLFYFGGLMQMLAPIPTPTVTPSPTATPTPTFTPSITPSPSPTVTPTRFPPRDEGETLVLVADILIPSCIDDPSCSDDPDDVTQRLVTNMRKNLADHPDIRIERLNLFIEEEGGSERAMQIGNSPEFNATFIIWGKYLKAPEVYLFFDIMETELPFFGSSYDQGYGPSQINQPSMFEFKTSLGQQWANVVAFATGLTLFHANDHAGAEPLFDIAIQLFGTPEHLAVDPKMERYIYFYRGTNYLELGRANRAQPDLQTLYDSFDSDQDELVPYTLGNLGDAYADLGQYEKAIEFYKQALAISREIHDRLGEGASLGNLGNVYIDLSQYEKAIEFYEQALVISREIHDSHSEGSSLGNLGIAYRNLGQYEKAIEFYEQALAIARDIHNRRSEGNHLGNLGNAYADLGQYEKAIEFYEQALAIARDIHDRRSEGSSLGNLGIAYRNLGQHEKTIEFYEQALAISREIHDRLGEGNHLGNLGNAYADLGQYEKAIEFYEQALAISREIHDRLGEGNHLGSLGNAYADLGQYEKAIEFLSASLVILVEIKSPAASLVYHWLGFAYNGACWQSSLARQPEIALSYCKEAIAIRPESPEIRDSRGLAYALLGETEKAIVDFEFFVEELKKLDNPAYAPYIKRRQGWIDTLQAGENPFTDELLAELREE